MTQTTVNENQSAVIANDTAYSIMPRNLQAQIAEAVQMRDAITTLFEKLLVIKVDFDRIPGTDKPTLLKPGAEMLCKVFKLAQGKTDVLDKSEDWEKGVFSYTIGMPLIHMDSGLQIAYGIGAANSMEKKHRYRKAKDANGNDIQIENPDPADLQNTLLKMANKRAFVDAVLKATGASRMFTQDMEDFGAATGQFETASSKQIGFIKKLFGGATDPDALAEISRIAGREVTSFDNIYRSEASRIIDAKKSTGGGNGGYGGGYGNGDYGGNASYGTPPPASQYGSVPPPQSGQVYACTDCGTVITAAENSFSTKKYGRALCRNCQKAANA